MTPNTVGFPKQRHLKKRASNSQDENHQLLQDGKGVGQLKTDIYTVTHLVVLPNVFSFSFCPMFSPPGFDRTLFCLAS